MLGGVCRRCARVLSGRGVPASVWCRSRSWRPARSARASSLRQGTCAWLSTGTSGGSTVTSRLDEAEEHLEGAADSKTFDPRHSDLDHTPEEPVRPDKQPVRQKEQRLRPELRDRPDGPAPPGLTPPCPSWTVAKTSSGTEGNREDAGGSVGGGGGQRINYRLTQSHVHHVTKDPGERQDNRLPSTSEASPPSSVERPTPLSLSWTESPLVGGTNSGLFPGLPGEGSQSRDMGEQLPLDGDPFQDVGGRGRGGAGMAEEETDVNPRTIKLTKAQLMPLTRNFRRRPNVRAAASVEGVEDELLETAMKSFIRVLRKPTQLDARPKLKMVVADVLAGRGHIDDLFPYFMAHTRRMYPHLLSTPELERLSDLTSPAGLFLVARSLKRRLVFHAGPTNSGKTHHAFQHFLKARSGVYCAPLRMLAHEIAQRSNKEGVPCDLLTGEVKQFASGSEDNPSDHLACTVEMANTTSTIPYDVAVVDEVQLIRDDERGAAWTRAILGLPAHEVHMCGHVCVVPLVQRLVRSAGEELEVIDYQRLCPLVPIDTSLRGNYSNVRPGDCMVVFSRNKIFEVKRDIEKATGEPCAIIYGGLPPATRVQQAEVFNTQLSRSNILVATDAIGMGVNLNIRRVVFHSLKKFDGQERRTLSSAHVKQIAGRAGRYGKHPEGEVTTFDCSELELLHELLMAPEEQTQQAGIYPTHDQIDIFSSYFPDACLDEILSAFFTAARLDGNYFLCNSKRILDIASYLRNTPMAMRDMFQFCLSPVDFRKPYLMNSLQKFAAAYSEGEELTEEKLCNFLQWPLRQPRTPGQLAEFEKVHETLDLYLWLGMRFPEQFVARDGAMKIQKDIERVIGRYIALHFRHPGTKVKIHDWMESEGQVVWDGAFSGDELKRRSSPNVVKIAERLLRNAVELERSTGTLGRQLIKSGRISPGELEALKLEWGAKVARDTGSHTYMRPKTRKPSSRSRKRDSKDSNSIQQLQIFLERLRCPQPQYREVAPDTLLEYGTEVTITVPGGRRTTFKGHGRTKMLSKASAAQTALEYASRRKGRESSP